MGALERFFLSLPLDLRDIDVDEIDFSALSSMRNGRAKDRDKIDGDFDDEEEEEEEGSQEEEDELENIDVGALKELVRDVIRNLPEGLKRKDLDGHSVRGARNEIAGTNGRKFSEEQAEANDDDDDVNEKDILPQNGVTGGVSSTKEEKSTLAEGDESATSNSSTNTLSRPPPSSSSSPSFASSSPSSSAVSIDWEILHWGGLTCDSTPLPHHVSDSAQVDALIKAFVDFLGTALFPRDWEAGKMIMKVEILTLCACVFV